MTTKLSEKEEDEIARKYVHRVMDRVTEGLDTAACAAVAMGFTQSQFMKAARHTFSFVDRWNKACREEENK